MMKMMRETMVQMVMMHQSQRKERKEELMLEQQLEELKDKIRIANNSELVLVLIKRKLIFCSKT